MIGWITPLALIERASSSMPCRRRGARLRAVRAQQVDVDVEARGRRRRRRRVGDERRQPAPEGGTFFSHGVAPLGGAAASREELAAEREVGLGAADFTS
jgi:hypothetical protein